MSYYLIEQMIRTEPFLHRICIIKDDSQDPIIEVEFLDNKDLQEVASFHLVPITNVHEKINALYNLIENNNATTYEEHQDINRIKATFTMGTYPSQHDFKIMEKLYTKYSISWVKEPAFKIPIKNVVEIFAKKLDKEFPNSKHPIDFGSKYARIWTQYKDGQKSAWGFITLKDNPKKNIKVGDLLKVATWKDPAKHARGNIIDGTSRYGEYGVAYLK